MRGIIYSSIILTGLIIASLVGCGDDDKGSGSSTKGIYAELMVRRSINTSGFGPAETDMYVVHLDSSYAPDSAVKPINSADIKCNGDSLGWIEYADAYYYPILQTAGKFLQLGATYNFVIAADDGLPALSRSITFPNLQPWLRTPAWGDTLYLNDDLTITWDSAGSGEVEISFTRDDEEIFFIRVPNNGSYTIPEERLAVLTAESYMLNLDYYTKSPIFAAGYDSRGFIRARVHNFSLVYFRALIE